MSKLVTDKSTVIRRFILEGHREYKHGIWFF